MGCAARRIRLPSRSSTLASLSGLWTGDDSLEGIYLNGNLLAGTILGGAPFVIKHVFAASGGSGFFNGGINTLDFKVNFADSRAEGLIVDNMELQANAIPEPTPLSLMGLAIAVAIATRGDGRGRALSAGCRPDRGT